MSTNWRSLVQRSVNAIITKYEIPLELLYRNILENHGQHKNSIRNRWVPEPYLIKESLELRDEIIADIRLIVNSSLSEELCIQIWMILKNRMALIDEVYAKLFLFFGETSELDLAKLTYVFGYKVIALQNVDKLKQVQYINDVLAKNPWIKKSLSILLSQKDCAEDILTSLLIQKLGGDHSKHLPAIMIRILHFAVIFNLPKIVKHLFEIALSDDKKIMLDSAIQHLFVSDIFTNERYQVFLHLWGQFDHIRKIHFLVNNNIERAIAAHFDFMFEELSCCTPEEIQNFLNIKPAQVLQTGYVLYKQAVSYHSYKIAEIIFNHYATQWQYFAIRCALEEAIKFADQQNVEYLGYIAKDNLTGMLNELLNLVFVDRYREALLRIDNQTIPILDINEFVRLEDQQIKYINGRNNYMNMIMYFYQHVGKDILTASDCFLFKLAMNKRSFSGMEFMMSVTESDVQSRLLEILEIDKKQWLSLVESFHTKLNARQDARRQFAEGLAALDKYIRAIQQPRLFSEKPKAIVEITQYFISAYIANKDVFDESIQNLRSKLFMYSKEFVVHLKNILSDVDPHLTSHEFSRVANQIKRAVTCVR